MKKKITAGSAIAFLIRTGTFAGTFVYFTRHREIRILDLVVLSVLCLVWAASGYWDGLNEHDEL